MHSTRAAFCILVLFGFSLGVLATNNTAQPCPSPDTNLCELPDCFCSSTNPFPSNETANNPQIVMISFDDALTALLYNNYYKNIFDLKNPDGCPYGITFFLSHDYTDYTLVNDVWSRGYEIASHSITHQTPTDYWKNLDYTGWVNEMYGLKQTATYLANIPMNEVIGTREPFLQGGGDTMFQVFEDYNFKYDCNAPTIQYVNPPLFPYTLDYKSIQDCQIPPCPQNSYPGFWEVPIVDFNSSAGYCAMLDSCTGVNGTDDTYNFLLYNFNIHYTTNKAPFGLFTHAAWFSSEPTHYDGYIKFLQYLETLPDVYVVTVAKAIEWMKNPTSLDALADFEPWQCPTKTSPCSPYSCHYTESTPGGERYMNSCVGCPPNYPWVGDPFGNKTSAQRTKTLASATKLNL